MAQVTITLRDDDEFEGRVAGSVEFDPPLQTDADDVTEAQALALVILESVVTELEHEVHAPARTYDPEA